MSLARSIIAGLIRPVWGLTIEDTDMAWRLAGGAFSAPGVWNQALDGSLANVDFTGLADAKDILVIARNVTKAVSGLLALIVSVDHGVSFYSTSGDYQAVPSAGAEGAQALGLGMHTTAATLARSGLGIVHGAAVSGAPKLITHPNLDPPGACLFVASLLPVNAVRILASAGGDLTGGQIYCLVR